MSDESTAMETGVLQLQPAGLKLFQLICDNLTLIFNDLNGYSRHFCPGADTAAHFG